MDEFLETECNFQIVIACFTSWGLKMIRVILLTRDRSSESKRDGVTLPDVDDAVEEVKLAQLENLRRLSVVRKEAALGALKRE